MHLLGRVADLYLYAPAELKEIINLQLRASNTQLRFNLVFTELASKETELIYENKDLEVHTIPLKHKILTNGFLIKETPRPRKIKAEKLKFYEVPHYKIDGIKFGEDFVTPEGETVPNEKFTFPPEKARSYAFCSDTAYREKIIPIIKGATMLYHETTFLERDSALAKKTFHSTAKQAGSIAKQSEVGKLLIGHFSARYTENDNTQFIAEVKQEFQNVEIAEELQTFEVGWYSQPSISLIFSRNFFDYVGLTSERWLIILSNSSLLPNL